MQLFFDKNLWHNWSGEGGGIIFPVFNKYLLQQDLPQKIEYKCWFPFIFLNKSSIKSLHFNP